MASDQRWPDAGPHEFAPPNYEYVLPNYESATHQDSATQNRENSAFTAPAGRLRLVYSADSAEPVEAVARPQNESREGPETRPGGRPEGPTPTEETTPA